MKTKQIRNWLGIYFLLITSILGGYILLFKETFLLPISQSEAISSFEIIVPVLVGQLTIIFKWYGTDNSNDNQEIDIPKWVIKGPPTIITIILALAITNLIIGNMNDGKSWAISPDSFRAIITFCVTILNATSIFIIAKFFKI